ncbi:MAG: hypothetical protein ACJ797_13725 [Ktedonobacteraceae bacterium]
MAISIWLLLLIVCAAGAVGGMINGLLSDNGFILPRTEQLDQLRIVHPGFLGNILIGIVAAGLSWGLYGPLSMTPIFSPLPVTESLTLSALVGAVIVGIGGARWITNEIDKKVLRVAASRAAAAPAAPEASKQIMSASPAEALTIAQKL